MPMQTASSCVRDTCEAMINFNSDWRCDGPARILSSNY
jgi:hypothetical protein